MKKAFLFAIAAAIVFPMISMADEPAAKPEPPKAQKERKAPQGPTLFKFDANKDGVVTKDELPKDNKFIEGMFNHTDADKDGKVTKEEEEARKAELKKRYEQYRAKAGDRPHRPQPPKGPRPQGPRPDGFHGPQGPRGPQQGPTLFKFDANKDGVVTKDELPKDNKFIEGMFNHTDADKDGKVTKEEEEARKAELKKRYEQYRANAGDRPHRPQPPKGPRPQGPRPDGFHGPRGPQQGPTLFKFDANKDGVVTKDELPADNKFIEGMFNHTDADKDGKVTKEEEAARKAELQKRYEQRRANAGDRPQRPMPPRGPRPQGQRPQGPRSDGFHGPQGPRGPMTLFVFDANKDGVVTKDELPKDKKFFEGMFDRTDADKDGKVTKEEEDAHKAELQKRYEQRKANGDKPRKPGKPGKPGKKAPEKK